MYSTFPRESSSSLERTSLQKLLVQGRFSFSSSIFTKKHSAELDLKTLDFTNPAAVDRFMLLSRDIRVKMNVLKEANFDVQRLEEQRDAVVERLVKTDSEAAIIKSELKHKDQDLAGLRVDTEIEREKAERLTAKVEHLEQVKAKIQRELFSREGELNRAQVQNNNLQFLRFQIRLAKDQSRNNFSKRNRSLMPNARQMARSDSTRKNKRSSARAGITRRRRKCCSSKMTSLISTSNEARMS